MHPIPIPILLPTALVLPTPLPPPSPPPSYARVIAAAILRSAPFNLAGLPQEAPVLTYPSGPEIVAESTVAAAPRRTRRA